MQNAKTHPVRRAEVRVCEQPGYVIIGCTVAVHHSGQTGILKMWERPLDGQELITITAIQPLGQPNPCPTAAANALGCANHGRPPR
jgi:hypothetical protein